MIWNSHWSSPRRCAAALVALAASACPAAGGSDDEARSGSGETPAAAGESNPAGATEAATGAQDDPAGAKQAEATDSAAEAPAAAPIPEHPRLEEFLAEGKHQEGLDWLRSFGDDTPQHQRYRGLFHHGLEHPDETLELLVPVYRAHPADDRVALAVAEASLLKKDYKTAVAVVEQLEEPEAGEALRVRGMVFEQAKRFEEALALYERAIAKLDDPWHTLERKALVLSWQERFDAALATYTRIADSKQAPGKLRKRARVHMAEVTAWKKDLDGALAKLQKLLDDDPRHVDALLLRGQILEWKGEFGEAKQTYSRILAVDSGNDEARLRLDKLLWVE